MKDLEQFVEDIGENEELRTALVALGKDEASVDALLKKEGYAVTLNDLKKYADEIGAVEPTEDELRKIAGGGTTDVIVDTWSAITSSVVGAGAVCFG